MATNRARRNEYRQPVKAPLPLPLATNKPRSGVAGGEELVNLFAQIRRNERGGVSQVTLHSTAGADPGTSFAGTCRGWGMVGSRSFAVIGSTLYDVTVKGGEIAYVGAIGGGGRCTIDGDDDQVVVASDGEGGYVGPIGGPMVKITDPDFIVPSAVAVIDSYAIWTRFDTAEMVFSKAITLEQYDALDFVTAESKADNLQRPMVMDNELYAVGEGTIEPWRNVGAAGTAVTFAPLSNAVIDTGTFAPWSCVVMPTAKTDTAMVFVDSVGAVRLMKGYQTSVISTEDVQDDIATVDGRELIGSWFLDGTNYLYALRCDAFCWMYNFTEGRWHRQRSYDRVADAEISWLCQGAMPRKQAGFVGFASKDGVTTLHTISKDAFTDNGDALVRTFTLPEIRVKAPTPMAAFEIEMETGKVPVADTDDTYRVTIDWSDDHGETWHGQVEVPMGTRGEFGRYIELTGFGRIDRSRRIRVKIFGPFRVAINRAGMR